MKPIKNWVYVRIPASTSNLGPGFDALGMALELYNEVEIRVEQERPASKKNVEIKIKGEGETTLPTDEKNIVWQAISEVFELYKLPMKKVYLSLKLNNRIPLARGLGSSAAARLGGVIAANTLCHNFLNQTKILSMVSQKEGHPDNVVPSLVGGLCVSTVSEGVVQFVKMNPPQNLSAVVCVPDFELSTKKAREALPSKYSREDAVFNIQRVALLLASISQGNYPCLGMAMEDRIHQPYRQKLIPGFSQVLNYGYKAGAYGVALSGAGPSVFALAPSSRAALVGKEMAKGFVKAGKQAQSLVLNFDTKGVQIQSA